MNIALPIAPPCATDIPQPRQLPLPGFEGLKERPRRIPRRHSATRSGATLPPDPLMEAYRSRLAAQGGARNGLAAYRYQLRAVLLIAARLAGRAVSCAELFRDPGLLGRALIDDTAPTRGTQLSRWTLAQRRSALRSFVTLMRPELLALLGEEPAIRLDRALQAVATRLGAGYRLTGGKPRRRGGTVPTRAEVAAILEATGMEAGYAGRRNRAFFAILAATGARVNALRELDGADCVMMPSGHLRLFLHEKGKAEPREVELGRDLAAALRAYADAFNLRAARRRWTGRVQFGQPGAIWRGTEGHRWSYAAALSTLRAACSAAGLPAFSPHALRRFFATEVSSTLPRHVVAQAGGWQGVERLDDHYIRPTPAISGQSSSEAAWRRQVCQRCERPMRQLQLFDTLTSFTPATRERQPLAATSEQLLQVFKAARLAEGAHPRSVARERSQLRAIARDGGGRSEPLPLADLFADLEIVARTLREPPHPVARSTGLARLRAAQRFIQHIGPLLGRNPAADLQTLDTLLPARRRTGGHTVGTVVAGTKGRCRRRGPTLTSLDLHRLIVAADARDAQSTRDRALVALHCFSGLRAEEILRLRWEELTLEVTEAGHRRLTAAVVRDGRRLWLPILGPATEAIEHLTQRMADVDQPLSGPIIMARADSGRPLSYRAACNVLRAACQRAGFPPAEAADLRAAFAYWLRTQGLSDHEVATVLGIMKVRSVDRLLRRHRALDAQRSARERLDR